MYAKLISARITNDISCRSAAKYYVQAHRIWNMCAPVLLLRVGGGTYIIIIRYGALDVCLRWDNNGGCT